jgi:hypothetical protein
VESPATLPVLGVGALMPAAEATAITLWLPVVSAEETVLPTAAERVVVAKMVWALPMLARTTRKDDTAANLFMEVSVVGWLLVISPIVVDRGYLAKV